MVRAIARLFVFEGGGDGCFLFFWFFWKTGGFFFFFGRIISFSDTTCVWLQKAFIHGIWRLSLHSLVGDMGDPLDLPTLHYYRYPIRSNLPQEPSIRKLQSWDFKYRSRRSIFTLAGLIQ